MTSRYIGVPDFKPDAETPIGILLVNTGSPAAQTTREVRHYLREFLADPRVVEAPRWLWWLILNGIILNTRPRKSAALYQKVWTSEGAPLLANSRHQAAALRAALRARLGENFRLELGMAYGEPSLREALENLRRDQCRRILALPMFPQYSGPTTGSIFDGVTNRLRRWRRVPELRFVTGYYDDPAYINALAASVRDYWSKKGKPERLLISFHGLPLDYVAKGDPYAQHCKRTTELLVKALELPDDLWRQSFQSRFGRQPWLQPYTDEMLRAMGQKGIKRVDVICPGFSADCLETLEEIAIQNRDIYLQAGGGEYNYIPALNDRADHIQALAGMIERHMQGWQ